MKFIYDDLYSIAVFTTISFPSTSTILVSVIDNANGHVISTIYDNGGANWGWANNDNIVVFSNSQFYVGF